MHSVQDEPAANPYIDIVELYEMYQHQDGGFYQPISVGKSTVDQSVHVIYEHVYPFEHAVWIRPIEEWTPTRFKKLTAHEYYMMVNVIDRQTLQEQIPNNKAARRLKESSA